MANRPSGFTSVATSLKATKEKEEETPNKKNMSGNSMPSKRFLDCKFCHTKHVYGKSNCPAYTSICLTCKEQGHYTKACPQNKKQRFRGPKIVKGNDVTSISCLFCGDPHQLDGQFCPAIGKYCANCGVQNHTEKVCPKKSDQSMIKAILPQAKIRTQNQKCAFCNTAGHDDKCCTNKFLPLKLNDIKISSGKNGIMKFCNYCAKEHSTVKGACKAYGKICSYCKRKNHTVDACQFKRRMQKSGAVSKSLNNISMNVLSIDSKKRNTSLSSIILNDIEGGTIKTATENTNKPTQRKLSKNEENSEEFSDSDSDIDNNEDKNTESNAQKPLLKNEVKKPEGKSLLESIVEKKNMIKAQHLIKKAKFEFLWNNYELAQELLTTAKQHYYFEEIDEMIKDIESAKAML